MAFASEEMVQLLNKIKPPYNIPGPVQEVALAALHDGDSQMTNWVKMLNAERNSMASQLVSLDIVEEVFPSDANFILVRFRDAGGVFQCLQEKKIIVRDRSTQPLCEGCLRLTIGTEEENKRLMQELRQFSF